MNKHTPGPWYFDEDDRAVGPVANRSIGVCSIMLADGDAARYHFGEQSIANANLIAAAPDLLEALEKMVEYAHQYSSRERTQAAAMEIDETPISNDVSEARAAIARAKGESS